jgi:hypothetical protein
LRAQPKRARIALLGLVVITTGCTYDVMAVGSRNDSDQLWIIRFAVGSGEFVQYEVRPNTAIAVEIDPRPYVTVGTMREDCGGVGTGELRAGPDGTPHIFFGADGEVGSRAGFLGPTVPAVPTDLCREMPIVRPPAWSTD